MFIRITRLLFVACLFILISVNLSSAYNVTRNAFFIFDKFNEEKGTGEKAGQNYRLYAKQRGFFLKDPMPKTAHDEAAWLIDVDVAAMNEAFPGVFFLGETKGIGADVLEDGSLYVSFIERERDGTYYIWKMKECNIGGLRPPLRISLSYNLMSTEFLAGVNGKTYLSGKAEDSSNFSRIMEIKHYGIKVTNAILNKTGYVDFNTIKLKSE